MENQILVFDVRLRNQLLETFPVLTVSGNVDIQTRIFQQFRKNFVARFATLLRQRVVELHGTVGRSITLHGNMLGSTVVFQVLIHIRLECLQIGVFQRFLGYVSLVDRIEDLGLVHAGSHAFVVARQSCHRIGVSQILLQGVHTLGNDQTALAYDRGVSLELLGLHDLARIGINQCKLVATRTFSLDTQLEFGNLHTLIVGELDMHGEHTARLLINDRIVLVHLRTLEEFRGTGDFSALEYHDRSNLHDSFGVEVLHGELCRNVGGNHTVIQYQHFRCTRQRYIIAVLCHLLEAVTARKRQSNDHEQQAQFHQLFHKLIF